MTHIIELAYLRMREIIDILERELEDANMILYYARDPVEGVPGPGGNIVHHTYMVDRARKALEQAKAALNEIQVLAYERGAIDRVPVNS